MALSPQESEFVHNWQLSILNVARDCDLTLVRCVRMIIRIVMPNTSPTLDLAEHAKQLEISPEDKEALVTWIRLLDEVSREGNRELCLRLQRVCEEVFHSQGHTNVMVHGVWDGSSSSSNRRSAGTRADASQQGAITQEALHRSPVLGALPAESPRLSTSSETRQGPSRQSSYGHHQKFIIEDNFPYNTTVTSYGTDSALCSRTRSGGG